MVFFYKNQFGFEYLQFSEFQYVSTNCFLIVIYLESARRDLHNDVKNQEK